MSVRPYRAPSITLGAALSLAAGFLSLLAARPTALQAQTVAGVVLEAGSDRPVPFAELSVLDTLGTQVGTGFADGTGAFRIDLEDAGYVQVYAIRLGYYSAVSDNLRVGYHQTVRVAVRLQPKPFEGDSITVEVPEGTLTYPPLERVGFYKRQQSGVGHFIDRLGIDQMIGVRSVTDVVREVPGVRISTDRLGKDRVTLRNTVGGSCIPMLILDGIAINPPWEDMMDPDDIDGLEVYSRASQVPPRFAALVPFRDPRWGPSAAQCGLLVAWTRTGNRRR